MAADARGAPARAELRGMDEIAWPTTPEGANPWPERVPEPRFDAEAPLLDLPDGLYYSLHASGRLRLLARVSGGRLAVSLQLADGTPSGWFKVEGSPWFAQRFYPEGLVEDFSRDDDTSEPYPAGTFEEWAQGLLERMTAPPPPIPEWLAESMRVYEEMKAGDRPPARADQVLSGAAVPADLDERLAGFENLNWSSQAQCHERLLHYFKWSPELARDFTNFATAACASAVRQPEELQQPEIFLHPLWDRPGEAGRSLLSEVPLYARVREAAQAAGDARFSFRHWCRCLSECVQARFRSHGRLPVPVVWTVPRPGMCGFHLARTCFDLLLRQEASSGLELGRYLAGVDPERFFAAASLAGAFLQGGFAASALAPDPARAPWVGSPAFAEAGRLLSGLVGSLRGPGKAAGSTLLVDLGEWVHREAAGGRAPSKAERPVVGLLGRFLNARGPLVQECLGEFQRGDVPWHGGSYETGRWPSEDGGPAGAGLVRERAEELLERLGLETGPGRNRFLHRVEVAFERLARGAAPSSARDTAAELERFLAGSPEVGLWATLSPDLGLPVEAGQEYLRWLAAAAWALGEWSSDPRLAGLLAGAMVASL